MRFLDVKTDYAFKKVFGSEDSKDKLISFLNALVFENRSKKIKDLTIVDPYNIPLLDGMKNSFVDVKAILDDDSKVIIEMQVLNHAGFEKRILYNLAKNYSVQLNKAEDYHLLNPVIALNIVDFTMFKETEKVITNFKLLEKEEFIDYGDDIELIFIELPKFKQELDSLQTLSDEWIYFLKNAGSLEYIPKNLNTTIQHSFDVLNEANFSKEELETQHKRKEFISIQRLAILKAKTDGLKQGLEEGREKGLEEGIEKGLKQGIEQGIEKGKEEATKQLIIDAYRNGTPTDLIGSFVKMSEAEVIELLRTVKDL
jgi:predicted transposase/invertase (TIGR01784 family)